MINTCPDEIARPRLALPRVVDLASTVDFSSSLLLSSLELSDAQVYEPWIRALLENPKLNHQLPNLTIDTSLLSAKCQILQSPNPEHQTPSTRPQAPNTKHQTPRQKPETMMRNTNP